MVVFTTLMTFVVEMAVPVVMTADPPVELAVLSPVVAVLEASFVTVASFVSVMVVVASIGGAVECPYSPRCQHRSPQTHSRSRFLHFP